MNRRELLLAAAALGLAPKLPPVIESDDVPIPAKSLDAMLKVFIDGRELPTPSAFEVRTTGDFDSPLRTVLGLTILGQHEWLYKAINRGTVPRVEVRLCTDGEHVQVAQFEHMYVDQVEIRWGMPTALTEIRLSGYQNLA